MKQTGFGTRYEVEGDLTAPDRRVAYEVEFVTLTDLTVAVVRVLPIRLRPVSRRDLTYVRELTPSKRAG